MSDVRIPEAIQAIVRGDTPRAAVSKRYARTGVQYRRQPFQKAFVGVVIRFRDPDVFSLREPNTFIPLFEWASGIGLVEFQMHTWIGGILAENSAAVVSRAIVQ